MERNLIFDHIMYICWRYIYAKGKRFAFLRRAVKGKPEVILPRAAAFLNMHNHLRVEPTARTQLAGYHLARWYSRILIMMVKNAHL
jgi:hypothetical protein